MDELNEFFQLNWELNRPNVFVVTDRKTIDSLRGRETEPWVVGWTKNRDVYLLDRQNFEIESSHKYNEEDYFMLLKHELAHYFTSVISKNIQKPVWLLEGISLHLAGQNKQKIRPSQFVSFLDYYEHGGKDVYSESGFVIERRVKKFGKEKLLTLLELASTHETKEEFSKLFKETYGFDLSYVAVNENL